MSRVNPCRRKALVSSGRDLARSTRTRCSTHLCHDQVLDTHSIPVGLLKLGQAVVEAECDLSGERIYAGCPPSCGCGVPQIRGTISLTEDGIDSKSSFFAISVAHSTLPPHSTIQGVCDYRGYVGLVRPLEQELAARRRIIISRYAAGRMCCGLLCCDRSCPVQALFLALAFFWR